ncbi:MAG: tripartite tricarboxylate transporter TctB family protein [Deltaproteobacteria bacterium]|nr:tripartite tricarboxylate transporter TctB family protein [Deltaproteobacteria bacterium]
MTIDRLGGAGLLLLALFVAWEDRVLPLGTHSRPGPGYLPLLLSSFLAVLAIILILRGRLSAAFRSVKWPEGRHALAILACCGFATLALERLGYRITMLILLAFLFGVLERLKWWGVLGLSLALSFGSFWVFDTLLKVLLPRGGFGF